MLLSNISSNRRQPSQHVVIKAGDTLRLEDGKTFLMACPFFLRLKASSFLVLFPKNGATDTDQLAK